MHADDTTLENRIGMLERRLSRVRYAGLGFAALASVLVLAAFQSARNQNERFVEIDVERINLIESDGTLRMVLANNARSPAQTLHGRRFGDVGGRPGMIFYNDEGGESGGLIFRGGEGPNGANAGASLTFDQFNQDQVVALQYIAQDGQQFQGLTILDRPQVSLDVVLDRREELRAMPEGPERHEAQREWLSMQDGVAFGARRLFVGRDRDKAAVVGLADRQGRVRLRIAVDSAGSGRIEFLDEAGTVVSRFPENPVSDAGASR
jgi:hypothetical protein